MDQLLGIDTGGTFTDFILYKNGEFYTQKILSTPEAPQQAILQGLQQLNVDTNEVHLVHGTTVATNALLEGKGARTAFVTNRGCKDLLLIGRQTRDQLYSLCPQRPRDLIMPQLCFEVGGRIAADGHSLERTGNADIQQLRKDLAEQEVDAIAICMLFSFLDDCDEIFLASALQDQYFVTRSSQILPEQREYERAVVTWLNSYLGPHTQRYLSDLQQALSGKHVHVMQSDATTLPAVRASKQAVKLLLSGPAGGVVAANSIAKEIQKKRLLTLDMGGTSTDVALIDEQPQHTTEGRIAEFPLAMPMLDIHTIGAGGGSIARVDSAGVLHVGPASAGADPGPACYGAGGSLPTITDANVVLGRLPSINTWTSGFQLDKDLAYCSMQAVAQQLNCSVSEAAQGIISLANAHMVQALRVISIHRGYDPREFCLFPFGGAGGLHMCEVAEQLGMCEILVPFNAGILSAFGMLQAPLGQMVSLSLCRDLTDFNEEAINQLVQQLQIQAEDTLRRADLQPNRNTNWLDLRYRGQSSVISIPWLGQHDIAAEFTRAHLARFGFQLQSHSIELVTARVWAYQDIEPLPLNKIRGGPEEPPIAHTQVVNCPSSVPVFTRNNLVYQQILLGPSIILDESGTSFISAGWHATVDQYGHLHLQTATDHRE